MDQIGSALSSGMGALSNVAPGFLGGGPGGWMSNAAGYFNPANMVTGSTGPTAMDPGTGLPSTGGVPTLPSDTAFTESTAGPTGSFGPPSVVNPPASSPASGVLASLFPSIFGPGGSAPAAPAAGGAPAAAAGSNQPSLAASLLKMSPELITGLLKYQQQQNLLDPSAMEHAEQRALKGQMANLRKSIYPGVTAQLQETGNINAPYLSAQAYTTAIAPYVQQAQQAAMEEYLRANAIALGLYPNAQEEGALGGLVNPSIFGGSSATA